MTAISGVLLYVAFKGVDLSTEYTSFEANETGDSIDVSAGADTATTYLTRLTDGTATYSAVMQADGSAIWTALAIHGEGTLEWADEGSVSTDQRHWVNAIVTGRSRTIPYAGAVAISATFQFSGAVTDTVYA